MSYSSGRASLEISEAQLSDAGQYTCIATNKLGEAECSCKIQVSGKCINIYYTICNRSNNSVIYNVIVYFPLEILCAAAPDITACCFSITKHQSEDRNNREHGTYSGWLCWCGLHVLAVGFFLCHLHLNHICSKRFQNFYTVCFNLV